MVNLVNIHIILIMGDEKTIQYVVSFYNKLTKKKTG